MKQTEEIFLSEGVLCLALRCRQPHCPHSLFDAVYWIEQLKDLAVQKSGENSGRKLQNLKIVNLLKQMNLYFREGKRKGTEDTK